jgi:hypothetical protein
MRSVIRRLPRRIETGSDFRRTEHQPGSQDRRNLGAWVEAAP